MIYLSDSEMPNVTSRVKLSCLQQNSKFPDDIFQSESLVRIEVEEYIDRQEGKRKIYRI